MNLPIVASLWIGGNLTYVEQVCLKSFVDHGHRVILYAYEDIQNAPEGVEVLDANRIFPATDFIRHTRTGSPAVHADAFRYRMISLQNVIWVDADILCMRPWNFRDQFVFGWEKADKLVCNAVLGLPRFSRTLSRLNAFCKDEYPIPPWASNDEKEKLIAAAKQGVPVHVSDLKWGVWGPSALTHFLRETGEIEHALPVEAFYPIPFQHRRRLLRPTMEIDERLGNGCYGVHLWNRRLKAYIKEKLEGHTDPSSFLGRALERHGIDQVLAPIPEKALPPHARDERAANAEQVKRTMRSDPPQKPKANLEIDGLQQSAAYQSFIDNLENRTAEIFKPLPPIKEQISHDNIVVLSSMKNEAPFILEWIAYHKSIGVKHFFIYTNDCTDQTNAILDRLADLGLVTRMDNPWDPASAKKPQQAALEDALSQPVIQEADWVLTIDVDEFVNIHVGDGTFPDLFKACNDPNVISFTWKFFGNDGVDEFKDRPVIEQFTACAPEYIPKPRLGWGFKSMMHRSAPYNKIGVHRPLNISSPDDVEQVRWVNGSGRRMPEMLLTNNGWRSTKRSLGYRFATLNHYILRSAESFLVKRDRGRINHVDQDQGIDYWMRRNYCTERDARMLPRLPRMQVELDALMQDSALAQLHTDAVAWHRARIETLKAQPEYAALYHELSQVPRPDAIYLTKPEEESGVSESAGVEIPEPEKNLLSPAEVSMKLATLKAQLEGSAPQQDAENPNTNAPKSFGVAPENALQSIGGQRFDNAPFLVLPPDGQVPFDAGDRRFAAAKAFASTHSGFFWEGPDNALYFEPRSKTLVVSFDNHFVVKTDPPRWPWGHEFLTQQMECSVLGVMGSQRNWFRHDFVHDCFDKLRDGGFFQQFDEVLFYGASMGGYAALTYARTCPGARVLAIAPQTTLDRNLMPDEDRWGWTRKLDWSGRYADARDGTEAASDVVVISDPYFELDRRQVERLEGDNIRQLRMPFFGHQLPNAFVNMGILKPLLTDMIKGELTNKRFYELMRARRDLARFQHDLLMHAEERGHLKLAIQVCEYTLKKRNARNIKRTLKRLQAEVGMS